MALLETVGTIVGGATAVAVAAYGAWNKFKQNQSNSEVGAVMNGATIDIVGTLTKQRDDALNQADKAEAKADKAEVDLDSAQDQIRSLTSQIANLNSQVSLLKQLVERLSAALDLTKNQLNQIIENTKTGADSTQAPVSGKT